MERDWEFGQGKNYYMPHLAAPWRVCLLYFDYFRHACFAGPQSQDLRVESCKQIREIRRLVKGRMSICKDEEDKQDSWVFFFFVFCFGCIIFHFIFGLVWPAFVHNEISLSSFVSFHHFVHCVSVLVVFAFREMPLGNSCNQQKKKEQKSTGLKWQWWRRGGLIN